MEKNILKEKIICTNCLNEFPAGLHVCPNCSTSLSKSYVLASVLKKSDSFKNRAVYSKVFDLQESNISKIFEYYNVKEDLTNCEATIKTIRIRNLFDYLNYDINFESNNSILIAPNGYGKTTIFKLLNFAFNPTFSSYREEIKIIPFSYFEIELSNSKKIILEKKDSSIVYSIKPSKFKDIVIDEKELRSGSIMMSPASQEAENELIFRIYENLIKLKIYRNVEFLETNRAYDRFKDFESSYYDRRNRYSLIYQSDSREVARNRLRFAKESPIVECNKYLKSLIQKYSDKYSLLLEEVKNTLPNKFLKNKIKTMMPYNEFAFKWNYYFIKLKNYERCGFVEKNDEIEWIGKLDKVQYEKIVKEKGNFLAVYLEEYEKTLIPFDELYEKIITFSEIIDSRSYANKTLFINKNGFEFEREGKKIDLDYLSSGEKNDFILFFNLIFKTENNTLLLIDEPEISLHIKWQEQFVKDVEKSLNGKNCQLIIATHSPQILASHEDSMARIDKK